MFNSNIIVFITIVLNYLKSLLLSKNKLKLFYFIKLYSIKANKVDFYSRVIESLKRYYSTIKKLYLYIDRDKKLPLI